MGRKKRRGRPKGSKNKNMCTESPAGNKYKSGFELPEGYREPKAVLFLGYCKCGFAINVNDLDGKRKYICPSCEFRGSIQKLLNERPGSEERPKSKKEYLEQTVNVQYNYYNTNVDKVEEVEEEEEEEEDIIQEDKKKGKDKE